MKTYKHLYEAFLSDENIAAAINNACRGDKSKKIIFRLRMMREKQELWIPKLRNMTISGSVAKHTPKEIYDGISRKKRTIIVPTVDELVVQHMIVNVLKPIFMKGMYEHSYAAIPGRGCHAGKKRMEKWIARDRRNTKYYLKLDIRHFFESVSQDILKNMLAKVIKDERILKSLYRIIEAVPSGLPLGFYTSQWFANWYLQGLDHHIKEKLYAPYYMRYMDDMVVLGGIKRKLHKTLNGIVSYIEKELELSIKGNYHLGRVTKDSFIDYMGFRFYSNRTVLRRGIMLKATRKASRIAKKDKPTVHDARQMLTYKGWLKGCKAYSVYSKWISDKISFKCLRKVISHYDRKRCKKNVVQDTVRCETE